MANRISGRAYAVPKNNSAAADTARGVTAADGTTKAKIERAALILFTQRGIDGVSIKEIAAEAGISDGAMYRYYPAKYKLAHDLMLEIHVRLTDLVREIAASDMALRVNISELVREYCALADDDWMLFAYHLLHLHHFPELFAPRENGTALDSPVTACAEIIDRAIESGEIPAGNRELLASMVLGIVVQAAQSKAYQRLKGPLRSYAPDFERAIAAVLQLAD